MCLSFLANAIHQQSLLYSDSLKKIISCVLLPIFLAPTVVQVTITIALDMDICSGLPSFHCPPPTTSHKQPRALCQSAPWLCVAWPNSPLHSYHPELLSPLSSTPQFSESPADMCWILLHLTVFVCAIPFIWNVLLPSFLCLKAIFSDKPALTTWPEWVLSCWSPSQQPSPLSALSFQYYLSPFISAPLSPLT